MPNNVVGNRAPRCASGHLAGDIADPLACGLLCCFDPLRDLRSGKRNFCRLGRYLLNCRVIRCHALAAAARQVGRPMSVQPAHPMLQPLQPAAALWRP